MGGEVQGECRVLVGSCSQGVIQYSGISLAVFQLEAVKAQTVFIEGNPLAIDVEGSVEHGHVEARFIEVECAIDARLVGRARDAKAAVDVAGGIAKVSQTARFEGMHGERCNVALEIQLSGLSRWTDEVACEFVVVDRQSTRLNSST